MTKEWSDQYNPFNSNKILIWREWLEGCRDGNFLPPITIDIDPSGKCNLNCIWCNFMDYNNENPQNLPEEHLIRIADFAKEWGVKSAHILGGGEPLMNPGTEALIQRLRQNNIPSGMITNGILLKSSLRKTISSCCRWIGISMDSGTADTYTVVKGIDNKKVFDNVIDNIANLCDTINQEKSTCSVCYKYLLHPKNAKDIFIAAKLAKSLGVNDFHIRPAGWENINNKAVSEFDFSDILEEIDMQIEQARALETDSFHVYGIQHKFAPNKQRKINYSKCLASPIVLVFGADGNCHLCGDRRGQKEFILCSHFPDIQEVKKYWNSEKHKQIIKSVKLKECPRCVLGGYQEIIEKVFINDKMCREFP